MALISGFVAFEMLEGRMLLAASNLILDAGFEGAGTGTGSGQIVQSGGRGALGTTAGVTNVVTGTNSFSVAGGNYLNSAVPAGSTPATKTIVSFTPADAAHSWNALTGAISVEGINYTTLNGAIDLFVRPNNAPSSDLTWFRPIDVSNISGTKGLRVILNGAGGGLQLQILTASGTLGLGSSPGIFTTNNSFSLPRSLSYIANPFVNGSAQHIGMTFSTDSAGKITVKLFGAPGVGAIDTASNANLLATQNFYASASVIGASPLPSGAWSITDRYNHAQATSVDYESVHLYQGVPATFPGIGQDAPAPPYPDVSNLPTSVAFNARRDWLLSLDWSKGVGGSAKYGMPYAVARLYQTNGADPAARNWTVTSAQEIDYVDPARTQRDYGDVIFNPIGVVRAVYTWGNSFTSTQLNDIAVAMREKYTWLDGGTENHELMRWSNAYLLAKKFGGDWNAHGHPPNTVQTVPAYALMVEAKAKLLTRIRQYLNQGTGEYLSPNYLATHLIPMANLYDFADDPELKTAADSYMTYLLALTSANVLDGYVVEPYARIVGYSNTGADSLSYDSAARIVENESVIENWLYWGQMQPTARRLTESRYNGGPHLVYLALSDYRPPERLTRLANGLDGGSFETRSLQAHWHDKPGANFRYAYRDGQYIMGSGAHLFYPDDFYMQHSLFGAGWKSTDALKYLQIGHPYWYADSEWTSKTNGFPTWMKSPDSPFTQIMQNKGTAIVLFNHPVADPWAGRGRSDWLPERDGHYNALRRETFVTYPQTMDEVVTASLPDGNVWYFLREGDTYIGIRTLAGNTSVDNNPANLARAIFSNNQLYGNRYKGGYIVEVGTKTSATSFAAFQAKLKSNPYSVNWGSGNDSGQTVDYTDSTGNHFLMTYNPSLTPNAQGQIPLIANMTLNGAAKNFNNWPAFQAPYLSVTSGVLSVQNVDGRTTTYDASRPAPLPIVITRPAAPSSSSLQINDGTSQRSKVTSLTVTFDQAVTLASDAFTLLRRSGTSNFALSILNPSGDQKNYVISFTGADIISNSLADGVYDLTIKASSVVDAYGQTLTGGDRVYTFHRLFGDANGDKTVTNFDYSQFKKTYGLSTGSPSFNAAFDYDGSGTITNFDYSQFKKRYGTSLIY